MLPVAGGESAGQHRAVQPKCLERCDLAANNLLSAEIWRHFRPRVLDVEIYFLRPIFWDKTFSVMVEESNERWQAICLAKDNKVMVEARINRIET